MPPRGEAVLGEWWMAGRWYCMYVCMYVREGYMQVWQILSIAIKMVSHRMNRFCRFMNPEFYYLNQPLCSRFIASCSSYHAGGPISSINSWGVSIPLKPRLISLNIRLSLLWTDKIAIWVCQIIFMLSMASSSCRMGSHGGIEANARLPNCVNNKESDFIQMIWLGRTSILDDANGGILFIYKSQPCA